ncbi:MAG: N-acetyltransferase family protein [Phycisphaerales bacterium]
METTAETPVAAAIRLANARDIPAILEIYNEAVRTRTATADLAPQSIENRISWFAARDMRRRPVLVAEESGDVVAWGAFTDFKPRAGYAPTAEVSVYVAARAAGRGIGRAMLDALLARAEACRIDRALALSFEHNEASLRLFRSRGFGEWGRLREACDLDGTRRSVVILGWSA